MAIGAAFWGVQMLWQQVLMADGRTERVARSRGLARRARRGRGCSRARFEDDTARAFATLACFFVMYLARRIGAQIAPEPGRVSHAEGALPSPPTRRPTQRHRRGAMIAPAVGGVAPPESHLHEPPLDPLWTRLWRRASKSSFSFQI